MRELLYLLLLLVANVPAFGQSLTKARALDFAAAFLNASKDEAGISRHVSENSRSSNYDARKSDVTVSSHDLSVVCSGINGMVVSTAAGDGFVVICGTDEQPQVVGYGNCSSDSIPSRLAEIFVSGRSSRSSVNSNVEWANSDGFRLPIPPLVRSVRHQSAPFNDLCPYYIYDDGSVSLDRCLVGCVATATEQVLGYYSYPEYLQDSIAGFTTANSGVHLSIPAGTHIDFDNILDKYNDGEYSVEQARAVAELSYYLGVACQMDWGVGSSGARLERMAESLHRAFGYRYVRCLYSYDYSPRRWFGLMMTELSANRPIVYAGYSTNGGGHAFVIDGINSDGFFHVTWGYGGLYDGYFDLGVLTPQENPLEPTMEGSVFGLGHLQQALFLNPQIVDYVTDDTLSSEHRIEVDTVVFNRNPDTNMFVTANIKVRNLSDIDVYSPIELLSYSKTDSVGFPADIDYLGLADGIVRAGSDTTMTAYLQFSATGNRKLALNTADSLYLSFAEFDVKRAYQPQLAFEIFACDMSDSSVRFEVGISNLSKHYWSGRKLTYSLFEGDYTKEEGDWRHFRVINLPPDSKMEDSVSFAYLKPDTKYTFVIRNPWNPALEYSFTTDDLSAVNEADVSKLGNRKKYPQYRLNHRIVLEYDESVGSYRQVLRRQ